MKIIEEKISGSVVIENVSIASFGGEVSRDELRQTEEKRALCRAKVMLLLGPLGSGKTTFLNLLLRSGGEELGKVCVIVNDVGKRNVDADRIKGSEVVPLTSGAICCKDLHSVIAAMNEIKGSIDTVIIEPTGIADGIQLRRALEEMGLDVRAIVLMDVRHHERNVERGIMETQLRVADLVGLTWFEHLGSEIAVDDERLQPVREFIFRERGDVPVVLIPDSSLTTTEYLGQRDDAGVGEIFELLRQSKRLPNFDTLGAHEHSESSHNFETNNISLRPDLTLDDLKVFMSEHKGKLDRAKGVIAGREFCLVHGDISLKLPTSKTNEATFIFFGKVDAEIFDSIKAVDTQVEITDETSAEFGEIIESYATMSDEKLRSVILENRDGLLAGYAQYSQLAGQKELLKREARFDEIADLDVRMQQVSDAIICNDPMTWIVTQFFAYVGTESQIDCVEDFLRHCTRSAYSCGKRFDYFNAEMKARLGFGLDETSFVLRNASWQTLFEDDRLVALVRDRALMRGWLKHERFKDRGRVAKWENYGSGKISI